MKSILKQLYDGEIFPGEHMNTALKEYKEKRKNFLNKQGLFIDKLDKYDTELKFELDDVIAELYEFIPMEMAQSFADGFILCMRMIIETLYIDK